MIGVGTDEEIFTSLLTLNQKDRFAVKSLTPGVALLTAGEDVISDVTSMSASIGDGGGGYVASRRRYRDADIVGAIPEQTATSRPHARQVDASMPRRRGGRGPSRV